MDSSFRDRLARNFAAAGTGGRDYGRDSFWKPIEGENVVRLYTFQHTVTDGDLKLGRYFPAESPVGTSETELYILYYTHFNSVDGSKGKTCGKIRTVDGRVLGNCPTCDARQKLYASPLPEDQKLAQNFKTTTRFVVNVVDLGNPADLKMKLWEMPASVMEKLVTFMKSSMFEGTELFGPKGLDFWVTLNKNSSPASMYSAFFGTPDSSSDLTGAKVQGTPKDIMSSKQFIPAQFQPYVDAPSKPQPCPVSSPVTMSQAINHVSNPVPAPTPPAPAPIPPQPVSTPIPAPVPTVATHPDPVPGTQTVKSFQLDDVVKIVHPIRGEVEDFTIAEIEGDSYKVKDADGTFWDCGLKDLTN